MLAQSLKTVISTWKNGRAHTVHLRTAGHLIVPTALPSIRASHLLGTVVEKYIHFTAFFSPCLLVSGRLRVSSHRINFWQHPFLAYC